jgi:hypothetical protein
MSGLVSEKQPLAKYPLAKFLEIFLGIEAY